MTTPRDSSQGTKSSERQLWIITEDPMMDYVDAHYGHQQPTNKMRESGQSWLNDGSVWLCDCSGSRIEPKPDAAPDPFKEFPRPWKVDSTGCLVDAGGSLNRRQQLHRHYRQRLQAGGCGLSAPAPVGDQS